MTHPVSNLLQILGDTRADILQIFLYIRIICNLGATTMAIFCFVHTAEVPTGARILAATDKMSLPHKLLTGNLIHHEYLNEDREREVLWKFGIGRSWFIARAFMIICFFLGIFFMSVGFRTWVWYQTSHGVATVATVALAFVGGISGLVTLLLFARKVVVILSCACMYHPGSDIPPVQVSLGKSERTTY
jgi:hypothetical protein